MVRLKKSLLWVRLFFVLMVGGGVPQSVQAATTNGVQDAIQATVQVVTYSRLNRANGSGSGSLILLPPLVCCLAVHIFRSLL